MKPETPPEEKAAAFMRRLDPALDRRLAGASSNLNKALRERLGKLLNKAEWPLSLIHI